MIENPLEMRIALLIILFLSGFVASASDEDRFVKSVQVSSNLCVVISEGDMEWRSIGSYTIRLHEMDFNNEKLPAGEFYSGLVRERNGSIEKVLLIDLKGDGKKEVVVTIRCAGTGASLSADAFTVQGKHLKLLAYVENLEPKVNCITALKKQIRGQKKK
jgi:hypothetical protein